MLKCQLQFPKIRRFWPFHQSLARSVREKKLIKSAEQLRNRFVKFEELQLIEEVSREAQGLWNLKDGFCTLER